MMRPLQLFDLWGFYRCSPSKVSQWCGSKAHAEEGINTVGQLQALIFCVSEVYHWPYWLIARAQNGQRKT